MNFAVFSPYWGSDRKRARNWRLVRHQFRTWGWPLYTAGLPHVRPRNAAAAKTDWDVGLFIDADILLAQRSQAEAALFRAFTTGAYTVAYSNLRYLTEDGTRYVVDGHEPINADYEESVGLTWECCFAIRRDLWERVGGFDERIIGYGGPTTAFYYAASTLGGRERIPGTAFHLAHRPVNRSSEKHFSANMRIVERYREAVDNPKAMAEVLAER